MMAATDCEPMDTRPAEDESATQPAALATGVAASTPPNAASPSSPFTVIPLLKLFSLFQSSNMSTDVASSNPALVSPLSSSGTCTSLATSAVIPVKIPLSSNNLNLEITNCSLSLAPPAKTTEGLPTILKLCGQEASASSTMPPASVALPSNQNTNVRETSSSAWPVPTSSISDSDYPSSLTHEGVTVTLKNSSLWKQFFKCGTEMIVSRPGRQMFPNCCYRLSGLDPDRQYSMVLSVVPTSSKRYRCVASKWEVNGPADTLKQSVSRAIVHRNSPSTGKRWMQSKLEFQKLKVTNDNLNQNGYIILHSMHRYIPRLHVIPVPDGVEASASQPVAMGSQSITFTFPQTEFMAVTCYQNVEVIQLKIDHNPLARSFKRSSRRVVDVVEDDDDDEDDDDVDDDDDQTSSMSTQQSTNNKNDNSPLAKGLNKGEKKGKQSDNKKETPLKGTEQAANSKRDHGLSAESLNKAGKQTIKEDASPKCTEDSSQSKEVQNVKKSLSTAPPSPKPAPVLKNKFSNVVLKPISFSPQRDRVKYTPCIRGGLALGDLFVVEGDEANTGEPPNKRRCATDAFNWAPTSPESSPGSPGYRKRKKKTYNRVKCKAGATSPTVRSTAEPVAMQPELDDVEGQLFVSFTSKEHLDSLTKVDESKRPTLPVPNICTPSIASEEVLETQEARLARLEDSMKMDLCGLKHRQVIHPQLHEVGLKLSTLDPTVCVDLQYLGVQLPPPSLPQTPTEALSSSTESPFVSRTGKTSDMTKIKGWKNKFSQSTTALQSNGSEKNLSAFCSNMLDEYLESEALQISERAAAFSTIPEGSVAYQLPAQSSSYVKTLDSALRHRNTVNLASESPLVTPEQPRDQSTPTQEQSGTKINHDSTKNKRIRSNFAHILGARQRGPYLSKFHTKLQQMEMKAVSKGLERTELTAERLSMALSAIVTKKTSSTMIDGGPQKENGKVDELACGRAFCRLGCLCMSLLVWNKGPNHCQYPSCMFGCNCLKHKISKQTTEKSAAQSPVYSMTNMDHDYQSRRGLHFNRLWNKTVFDDDPEPLCVPATPLPISSLPRYVGQRVDEEEKDPVYKYLESMMTCARVRPFDCPPVKLAELNHNILPPLESKSEIKDDPVPMKDETALLTVNLTGDSSSNEMQASKQIEIESACKWKKDQKMVLEGIFRQIEKKSLSEQFYIGPYCISPITRIFMKKPSGTFLTYRIRISRQQRVANLKGDDSVEEDLEIESDKDEGDNSSKHNMPTKKFGVVPFMMGLTPAGLLTANKVDPGGCATGRIQVNGKFYNHTKLLLGSMGALHPANRLAAYITGRVLRTQVTQTKSAPAAAAAAAATVAPVAAQNNTVVTTTQVAATSTATATLASLSAKAKNATVVSGQGSVSKTPSALLLYVPNGTSRQGRVAEQSSTRQIHQKNMVTSPVSLTVSSSLKQPSFLEQSGTSTFRIYPPRAIGAQGQTQTGLSLPGGFTLCQLPKPGAQHPGSENKANVVASSQDAPSMAANIKKTSSVATNCRSESQKVSISGSVSANSNHDNSDEGKSTSCSNEEHGRVKLMPDQDISSEDDSADTSDSEDNFVDIVTVKEEQGLWVEKLREDIKCEPGGKSVEPIICQNPREDLMGLSKRINHIEMERQRRSEQRELFSKLQSVLMSDLKPSRLHLLEMDKSENVPRTSPRRFSHVEVERQRRSEQRKLFGKLQSLLKSDPRSSKLQLLSLTMKEIKNLQDTAKRLKKTKEMLLLQQKTYLKKLEVYTGTSKKVIKEKLSDVCHKQKLREKNMKWRPLFSHLLQTKAALLEVITPQSKEAMTPLLVPDTALGPFQSTKDQSESQSCVSQTSTKNKTVLPAAQTSTECTGSEDNTNFTATENGTEQTANQPNVQDGAEQTPLLVTMDPEEARAHWNCLSSVDQQAKDQNSTKNLKIEPLLPVSLNGDKKLVNVKEDPDTPNVKSDKDSPQTPVQQENPSNFSQVSFSLPLIRTKTGRIILPSYLKPGQETAVAEDGSDNAATTNNTKPSTVPRFPVLNSSVLLSGCARKDVQSQQKTVPNNSIPETGQRKRGRPRKEDAVQEERVFRPSRCVNGSSVDGEAKRPRGRPLKSKSVKSDEVNFDKLFRQAKIRPVSDNSPSSRPQTRASLGKDFPSEKRRSWIDLEMDLELESEVDIEGF